MVIGFVRIGTVIIRIRRTNVGGRDDVVTKAVQEHGSPASGDMSPQDRLNLFLDIARAEHESSPFFGTPGV